MKKIKFHLLRRGHFIYFYFYLVSIDRILFQITNNFDLRYGTNADWDPKLHKYQQVCFYQINRNIKRDNGIEQDTVFIRDRGMQQCFHIDIIHCKKNYRIWCIF